MTTTDLAPTIETYVKFWNVDAEEQRRLADGLFADDLEYHAIVGVLDGVDALVQFREQFVAQMGDATFRSRGPADHLQYRARLPWELVLADGTSFATGTDILDVADDGRIESVSVFLDRPPEGFEHHDR